MSVLFDPVRIRGLIIRNRFVRSATYDGAADTEGMVTPEQIRLFRDLAAGGTGLLVTGIAHVHPLGQISPFQNAITDDTQIAGLKNLTDTVHEQGAVTAVQLFHAGREAAGFLKTKKREAIGPSEAGDDPYFKRPCRKAEEEEIESIVRSFGEAAKRAKAAGFDAVQVHGAHAYLFSQFLSPFTNRRADRWGGRLENRLRLHKEVLSAIREAVGPDYPVLIKLGVADGFSGGLEFSEGLEAARLLAEYGYDGLEISQGLRGRRYAETEFRTGINRPEQEAYFRSWAREVKMAVDVPVVMVGGLRSLSLMEAVVESGEADFVSLCRPLIKEPGIVGKWRSGSRRKPTCISCNMCYEALVKEGLPLHCAYEKRGRKLAGGESDAM